MVQIARAGACRAAACVCSIHGPGIGAGRERPQVANLKLVERAPALADQVYEALRTQLRDGAIAAGQPLQEVQLAELLGVSRTPVREAMMRLASEGLLSSEGRSFVVPELTLADVDYIYEMRFLIEPAALRGIAPAAADPARSRAPIDAALADAVAAHQANDARPSARPPRAFARPGWRWFPTRAWCA